MTRPDANNRGTTDPLVDEVRAIRRRICEEFGNDVEKLCDHLAELEQRHAERLVIPGAWRTEQRPAHAE